MSAPVRRRSVGNAITRQPQSIAALPVPSAILPEVPQELNRIQNLSSIIFRPARQVGCSTSEYEVLEEREFSRLFRGLSQHGCCSCELPAISLFNVRNTLEVLRMEIDSSPACSSVLSGTISSPPGNVIGKAIHNAGWFSENFEIQDASGSTAFLCSPRRRWNYRIPDFEIMTTNMTTIGRITISVHSYYGAELTLRWLIEDVSSQNRILALGFLMFLFKNLWSVQDKPSNTETSTLV